MLQIPLRDTKNRMKRAVAILMALILIMGTVPVNIIAEGYPTDGGAVYEYAYAPSPEAEGEHNDTPDDTYAYDTVGAPDYNYDYVPEDEDYETDDYEQDTQIDLNFPQGEDNHYPFFPPATDFPQDWQNYDYDQHTFFPLVTDIHYILHMQDGFIYFGRPTCPHCVDFEPWLIELATVWETAVHHFNTDDWREHDRFMEIIEHFGITTVPAIVMVQGGMAEIIFNGQDDDDWKMYFLPGDLPKDGPVGIEPANIDMNEFIFDWVGATVNGRFISNPDQLRFRHPIFYDGFNNCRLAFGYEFPSTSLSTYFLAPGAGDWFYAGLSFIELVDEGQYTMGIGARSTRHFLDAPGCMSSLVCDVSLLSLGIEELNINGANVGDTFYEWMLPLGESFNLIIQRTSSFVQIDGGVDTEGALHPLNNRDFSHSHHNYPNRLPQRQGDVPINPATITVGRPPTGRSTTNPHGGGNTTHAFHEYFVDFVIYNVETGAVIHSGTMNGVGDNGYIIDTFSVPNNLPPGLYNVSVTVRENTPGQFANDPNITSTSTGQFIISVDFPFTKHDNNSQPLPGAAFTLQRLSTIIPNATIGQTYSSTSAVGSGLVSFTGLLPGGTYQLTETAAPTGFITPTGYWLVSVDDAGTIIITAHGGNPPFSGTPGSFTVANFSDIPPTIQKTADREYVFPGQEIEYTILVHNPNTAYVWEDLVVVDHIRIDLVEFLEDTLYIDGSPAPVGSFSFYAYTGELRIYLDPLDPDQEVEITFSVRVRVAETPPQPDARRLAFTPTATANRQSVSPQAMGGGYVGIMPRFGPNFIVDATLLTSDPVLVRPLPGVSGNVYRTVTNPSAITFSNNHYPVYMDRLTHNLQRVITLNSPAFQPSPVQNINYQGIDVSGTTDDNVIMGNQTSYFITMREGFYRMILGGTYSGEDLIVRDTSFLFINIQRTSSFVDFDGARFTEDSSLAWGQEELAILTNGLDPDRNNAPIRRDSLYPLPAPIVSPITVTVGRPVQNRAHGDIDEIIWTIYHEDGTQMLSRTFTSEEDFENVSNWRSGLYTVRVEVRERVRDGFPNDTEIWSVSYGQFIIPDDNGDQPGTIPNTAILYHDGEELDRDIEIVELLVQPRITKGVNVPFGQTVEIGQYVTYTLTVNNPNEVNLYDFLVVDNLAGGALIGVHSIAVSPNVGYTTQETVGELRVLLNYLPAEGSVTITFQARLSAGTPAGPVINIVHLYNYDTETSDREFVDDCYAIITLQVPQVVNITVNKIWNDNNNAAGFRPPSINMQLLADGLPHGGMFTLSAVEGWTRTFTGLPRYRDNGERIVYTIVEVNVPAGYTEYIANPVIDPVTGNVTLSATNSFDLPLTQVTVNKSWADNNNAAGFRPNTITVQLLRNGEVHGAPVTLSAEGWQHVFTGLPRYSAPGVLINWTVAEINVPTGYTPTVGNAVVDGNGNITFAITNTFNMPTTQVTVNKAWNDDDNAAGFRPASITVQLYADGVPHGGLVTLSAVEGWTRTFTGLQRYRTGEPGVRIEYTIVEINVPTGYTAGTPVITIVDGNIVISFDNTFTMPTTQVAVSKEWSDNNNAEGFRPSSITVQLYADGVPHGGLVTLYAANDWTHLFTNLPRYSAPSVRVVYTIVEVNVPTGYTPSIGTPLVDSSGNVSIAITNIFELPTTQVTVNKDWGDNNNAEGFRPAFISVQLFADGIAHGGVVNIYASNGWTRTFGGLQLYRTGQPGVRIAYTIEEINVPTGYTANVLSVVVNSDGSVTIELENTFDMPETEITVTKEWADNDDMAEFRPSSITVQLQADGVNVGGTVTLTAPWTHTFDNLPRYSAPGVRIVYTIVEVNVPTGYTELIGAPMVDVNGNVSIALINTLEMPTTNLTITKDWDDNNDEANFRPANITIQIYADGEPLGGLITLSDVEGWTRTLNNLQRYSAPGVLIVYSIQEVNVPTGYTPGNIVITEDANGNFTITFENTFDMPLTQVTVEKDWNDNDDEAGFRPLDITVQLYADGVAYGAPVTISAPWTHTFDNLQRYSAPGVPIVYTVVELYVPLGYADLIGLPVVDPVTGHVSIEIVNTYTATMTTVTVDKQWDDNSNAANLRPASIQVQLYADGVPHGAPVTLSAPNWQYNFTDLPRFSAPNVPIVYTVVEVNVPTGYSADVISMVVAADGSVSIVVENTFDLPTTNVTVEKEWDDNNDAAGFRPDEITVQLYADGIAHGEPVTLTAPSWSHTFNGLVRYSAPNVRVVYTVVEINVPTGYTPVIGTPEIDENGNVTIVIENTFEMPETEVTVNKTWVDNNDAAEFRPTSITIQLYADGVPVGGLVTLSYPEWTYTFENLQRYSAPGVLTQYTVVEVNVPAGYAPLIGNPVVDEDGNISIMVQNVFIMPVRDITVEKEWFGDADAEEFRPTTITVQLYADGQPHGGLVTLSAVEGWTRTFTGLQHYSAPGIPIVYTVVEVNVATGYTDVIGQPVIDANGNVTIVIENTFNMPQTEVTVNKVWADNDDAEGFRPNEITVQLYADGVAVGGLVTLSYPMWTYTFTNLQRYSAPGVRIVYTVVEVNVATGYTASVANPVIEADGTVTIVVTNTFDIPQTEVTVQKVWDDSNDAAEFRPATITVQLYADGVAHGTPVTLSAVEGWTRTFTGLQRFSAPGIVIVYTVVEVNVPTGYAPSIADMVIGTDGNVTIVVTNTFEMPETEVPVQKVWDDNDDYAGIRPLYITAELRAGGVAVTTVQLNEANDWQHIFANLPKYSAPGVEIVYTVVELDVPAGYTSAITGDAEYGFTITNTYVGIPTPELSIEKLVNSQDLINANVGETITYTIIITNAGDGEATDLLVIDDMTHLLGSHIENLSIVSVVGTTSSAVINDGVLTLNIPTLAPSGVVLITFQATIIAGSAGNSFTNTARLFDDEDEYYDDSTVEVPSLTIAKTVNGYNVYDGTFASEAIEYVITVTNTSPYEAYGFRVFDDLRHLVTAGYITLPAQSAVIVNGTTYTLSLTAEGLLTVDLGVIAPNGVVTITIPAVLHEDLVMEGQTFTNTARLYSPTIEGERNFIEDDTATVNLPDLRESMLSLEKLVNGEDSIVANIGETITYTITVRNDGTAAATDLIVRDDISAIMGSHITNVRNLQVAVSDGSAVRTSGLVNGVLSVDIANLAVGGEIVITFQATVIAQASGSEFDNTARLYQDDEEIYDDTATVQVPELTILKQVNDGDYYDVTFGGNRELEFIITVENISPYPAVGFRVVDDLSGWIGEFIETVTMADVDIDGEYTYAGITGDILTVIFGLIAPGETATITINANLLEGLEMMGQTFDNTASLYTPNIDDEDGELVEDSTVTVRLPGEPSFTITKVVNDVDKYMAAQATDVLIYTITVTNISNYAATGFRVVDDLRPLVGVYIDIPTAVVVDGTTADVTNAGGLITVVLGLVEPGEPVTITVTAPLYAGLEMDGQLFTNTAVLRTPSTEEDENGTAIDYDTATVVFPVPRLEVVKSVNYPLANVDDTLLYTIEVTNTGNANARDIWMVDDLTHLIGSYFTDVRNIYVNGLLHAATLYGTVLEVFIPVLNIGDTVTITFQATVIEEAAGQEFTNTAILTDDDGDQLYNREWRYRYEDDERIYYWGQEYETCEETGDRIYIYLEDDATVEVPELLRPTITKTATVPTGGIMVGDFVGYTLTVTNPNVVVLQDFIVLDNLAMGRLTGARNVSVYPATPFSYVIYSNAVTGFDELRIILDLPVGDVAITFEARVMVVGSITNTVYLYEDEDDIIITERDEDHDYDDDYYHDGYEDEDDDTITVVEVQTPVLAIEKLVNGLDFTTANVGSTVTYTIRVRNTGAVAATGIQVVDNLSHLIGSRITDVRNITVGGVAQPSALNGNVLTVAIPYLAANGELLISFQATVLATAVSSTFTNTANLQDQGGNQLYYEYVDGGGVTRNRPIRDNATVQVPGDGGGDDTTPPPELIKNPDRTALRVGETLGWTLRNFHNYTGNAVFDFTIVDLPSRGLNFLSASLPAFTNGAGVTYDIRYRVYGSNEWRTHATGIDASRAFTFSLPQPGNLYYTDIEFFFGNVPVDFGHGNIIRVYFVVGADAPNNVLLNRFIVSYNDSERQGGGTANVVTDPPTTGDDGGTWWTPPGTPPRQPGEAPTPYVPQRTEEQTTITYEQERDPDDEEITQITTTSIDTDEPPSRIWRPNPRTGDEFSPFALVASVSGVILSVGAALLLWGKKSKEKNQAKN